MINLCEKIHVVLYFMCLLIYIIDNLVSCPQTHVYLKFNLMIVFCKSIIYIIFKSNYYFF